MGDVFVRRTTALLLVLVFALSVICVALIVLLIGPNKPADEPDAEMFSPERNVQLAPKSSSSNAVDMPDPHQKEHKQMTEVSNSESQFKEPWEKNIRIPRETYPYHYDLFLHPNLETATFDGRISILIGVTSEMNYLLTHVKLMNVTSTELFDSSGSPVGLRDPFEYEPNQFWVVRPNGSLLPGNYTLSLKFNGGLKGHIVGFYMSEYLTKSGERRSIATSKFQPTDARRAFPCFDEPSFKSTFKTTLVRPSNGYIALSNMPVMTETANSPSPGLTSVEFETSVPMVTYLACFIVCDFEYVEVKTNSNKPFRVYATPDQMDRTQYSRDIGVNILNFFENYFEVEYPLPKQDMIAIPDFVSGAMEHWGLITYRETNLLFDPANSSSYNQQRVASVVSHELAHMWFGNLVTLEWWDDLWLNEGFASYIEYKGVAHYEKDWHMMDQFLTSDLHPVLELDQILSSHPIVQPVNHPDEITEIFDKISYSKGASVLRMLEDFIGTENFRVGVRNFLQKFKYRNAVTQDLWNELQKTVLHELNVTRVMDTWTRQMGFPVLSVRTSTEDKSMLEVTQQRFLVDPNAVSDGDSPFDYKWDIPVTFKTQSMGRKQVWYMMDQDKITLQRGSESDWVKVNVGQFGYYRVNYDEHLWKQLISVLLTDHQLLSPSDRANLLDDSFSLSAAALLSYDTAFQILSYLPTETHFVPWAATGHHLESLGDLLRDTPAFKFFRKFVVRIVDKHVERVGWDDTGSHTERRTRVIILNLACSNGHEGCKRGAVRMFKAWIQDESNRIPVNLRTLAYVYGIEGTGEAEWNMLLSRFLTELNAQEKSKMLRGLTSTKESWIAHSLLEMGKNETIIRKQDFFTMLSLLAYNPATLPHVWSFVRSNWEWMVEEFGLNNRYLGRMVRNIGYQFSSPLQLKEMKSFFEEYPNAGSGKRSRQQALEKIGQNIKWIEAYRKPLEMWLRRNEL